MIGNYHKISIIYGGKAKQCAVSLDEKINRIHKEQGYPIQSFILAEKLLSSKDIVNTVKQYIDSSTLCIILLTFDDMMETRVRQNVLIEIGMALMLVGKEKCIVISEREKMPEDFPSDIRSLLNINHMDVQNAEETSERLVEIIKDKLNLKSNIGILTDKNYVFDYSKVIDDVPDYVFLESPDNQKDDILTFWEKRIYDFSFLEERIIYILERVPFFPVLTSEKNMKDFVSSLRRALNVKSFPGADAKLVDFSRNAVGKILDFILLELEKQEPHMQFINDVSYNTIYKNLEQIKADYCNDINWYLRAVVLDYSALARLHLSKPTKEILESAINDFIKVEDILRESPSTEEKLWKGFVQFNLARTYEKLYNLDNDPETLDKVRDSSLNAISTRRDWTGVSMKGFFTTFLSCEYFLALEYEVKFRNKYKGKYSDDTSETLQKFLDSIISELTFCCRTTGLERLFLIRDRFVNMSSSLNK